LWQGFIIQEKEWQARVAIKARAVQRPEVVRAVQALQRPEHDALTDRVLNERRLVGHPDRPDGIDAEFEVPIRERHDRLRLVYSVSANRLRDDLFSVARGSSVDVGINS